MFAIVNYIILTPVSNIKHTNLI